MQLPLPDHIDEHKVINSILPEKDVDGFHPVNIGKLMIGEKGFSSLHTFWVQKNAEVMRAYRLTARMWWWSMEQYCR